MTTTLATLSRAAAAFDARLRAVSRHPLFAPGIALFVLAITALFHPSAVLAAPLALGTLMSEGNYAAEFLLNEVCMDAREAVTVLEGQVLLAGHVVSRKLVSPTVGAVTAAAGNTGNGTGSGNAVGTNLGVQRGVYRILFIEPAANGGTFAVYDPSGILIGKGVVGSEFDNQIKFTIADGATDFVSGDNFTVTVTGGTYKVKEYDPTDTDGGQRVYGVLLAAVDATDADMPGVAIIRDAEVASSMLTWFSGATSTQKQTALDALAAKGVLARS